MKKVNQSPGQKAICQVLNFYFKKTGWKKDRWSLESGVSAGRIGKYLSGEINPDEPTLEKLLEPLGISFTKFYRAKEFNYIPCRNKTVQN
jgi:transcriptional regulator with XRE-family HTH domain